MSLSEQINLQYRKRENKESLYNAGYYTDYAQAEINKNIQYFLEKSFANFKNLSLLEIGAGTGQNAYIFESFGFQRSNISFNELLKERIEAIKSKFPDNKVYEGDATVVPIDKKFDVIFQSVVFTSILKQEDRVNLANRMWRLLNENGIILWYDFIYNNPKNKDVRKVTAKEVKELFPQNSSMLLKKITLAPPIGRKVGKFYKLFNLPFLRSHILVVLKK
ncbi:MAG: methyltransferase domain-containing protein [Bacteroidota bacterium]|jgi:SAM-dependent methyltransferase